jgi:hypothetical protein
VGPDQALLVPPRQGVPSAFARWLNPPPGQPAQPSPTAAVSVGPGPTCTARLLAILERCWQCRKHTGCLLGILVPEHLADQVDHPEGFVQFNLIAEALAAAVDPSLLRALQIAPCASGTAGPLAAPTCPMGAVTAAALQENFPLIEKVRDSRLVVGSWRS